MRSDKGLLMSDGTTWAARAAKLISGLCDRVVYSIRAEQQPAYAAAIAGAKFVVDAEGYRDIGPLGGLLSVHDQFPLSDVLLLACDMTDILAEDLRLLTVSQGSIRVYRSGGYFEPLCAFYSAIALDKIAALFHEAKISPSLQKLMSFPELQVTSLAPAEPARLKSHNVPLPAHTHERE